MSAVRERLQRALAGEPIRHPVYAVYDWFVKNRPLDWPSLFAQGLGQIAHAPLLEYEYPNAEIRETTSRLDGAVRRDVYWVTERGELHEWFLGEWRQEHLVKSPQDYRILARALEGSRFKLAEAAFERAEEELGAGGIAVGQLGPTALESRTPLQAVQIDCAGLERFSIDLAQGRPELLELLERMNERTLEKFRLLRASRARHLKLWENLSIQTMGPEVFRAQLQPLYRRIAGILAGTGKKLQVHYDGKLRLIAAEIGGLGFDGIDSLTGPPEGDLSAAEARALWPGLFLWLHPNLGWYALPIERLQAAIRSLVRGAGPARFCLLISEEVPPGWRTTIPAVLSCLRQMEDEAC